MISLYQILSRNFTSRNRQQVNIVAAGVALAVNATLEPDPDPAVRHRRRRTFDRDLLLARRAASCSPCSCASRAAASAHTVLVGADDLARYPQLLMATSARFRRSSSAAK